jgi:myo-inositol-1(or 4)-monophosphatase
MGSPEGADAALSADWLAVSHRAAHIARETLGLYPAYADRARETGRGEGGDMSLAIDRAVEDAVLGEIASLGVGVTAVSEERGPVPIAGGGDVLVVVDPIDGSLNAKRGLAPHALSIAVAAGGTMADVVFGYVAALSSDEEWWAARGGGAFLGGERLTLPSDRGLEILGVESAHPRTVADASEALAATGARRLRMIGSIAVSLCHVASARFDAMISLRPSRSVDAAAGQLIVREAGGTAAFPDVADGALGASLKLDMRSRVVAAPSAAVLAQLGALAQPRTG